MRIGISFNRNNSTYPFQCAEGQLCTLCTPPAELADEKLQYCMQSQPRGMISTRPNWLHWQLNCHPEDIWTHYERRSGMMQEEGCPCILTSQIQASLCRLHRTMRGRHMNLSTLWTACLRILFYTPTGPQITVS